MNYSRDTVDRMPTDQPALIFIDQNGEKSVIDFGTVSDLSQRLAGTISQFGIGQGDVVMTVIGNKPEWVYAMVACFRIGAVVMPCSEQLRAKDIALRIKKTETKLVITDHRNLAVVREAQVGCPVLALPDPAAFDAAPAEAVELDLNDPCLIIFTSGTASEPKAVLHGQRYLSGQQLQATHWFAAEAGELAWCTAASGWSKSARNVFVAPWLRGATALLHDGRFDPQQRLEILQQQRVNRLCMSPTEYRLIAKRAQLGQFPDLRGLVAAGEALNPEVISIWQRHTSLSIFDGYGQTETGQITAPPRDRPIRPGSMGMPLPGIEFTLVGGELVLNPETVPTFFLGYLGEDAPSGDWHTGDLVNVDEDGYLYFEGRNDDLILSSGYRIGPFEVESALLTHPAVTEAAVVAAPDPERGSVVKAYLVIDSTWQPSEQLKQSLQLHVKEETAPYKYPRRIEFVDQLPKTSSGKIKRSELRRNR